MRKLSELPWFAGQALLVQCQKRGVEILDGSTGLDALPATFLGLIEHLVEKDILRDPE